MPKRRINPYALGPTFDKLDEQQSRRRNTQWRINNRAIKKAWVDYYRATGTEPTLPEIAQITDLSLMTIHRHMAEIETAPLFDDIKKEFAMFAGDVMLAVVNAALKGNSRSQEIYLRTVLGWHPDAELAGDKRLEQGLAEALAGIEDEDADDEVSFIPGEDTDAEPDGS